MPTLLETLAEQVGIEPGYHDIWGTYRVPSDDTKRRILAALGLAADDDAACRESLDRLAAADRPAPLPPTQVVAHEAQPGAVALRLPPGSADPVIAWRLRLEDGAVREGRVAASALAPADAGGAGDGAGRRLPLPAGLPMGYHDLTVAIGDGGAPASCRVIVAPDRCWTPEDTAPGAPRMWGVSCQLYALRGGEDWGIGTFSDLAELAAHAAAAGADGVGLNPLHALFPADPAQISPYSPASRLFLNVLYIDPRAVPEFADCAEAAALLADQPARAALAAAPNGATVDYPRVAGVVLPLLACLYRHFRSRHLDAAGNARTSRGAAFLAFRKAGGDVLRDFAVFHALQARFVDAAGNEAEGEGAGGGFAWHGWPAAFRRPDAPAVRAFADAEAADVDFHIYLQWLADGQLAAAADRARAAGMRVGLYRDLAVGIGADSASAWVDRGAFVPGISVGAPPDLLNHLGQSWGILPLNPLALADQGYAPIIRALRANMAHAGALRIDHVMGLMHLFWVPVGAPATEGAYVRYPFADLLRIVALESRRNRCIVIGEDLGTVPDGFRPTMAAAGILSYSVFQFERVGDRLFRRASDYPEGALVTAGTHDMPTLASFWSGDDLALRRRLKLYPDRAMQDRDVAERGGDRQRLLAALLDAGLIDPRAAPSAATDATDDAGPAIDEALLVALHRFLARTPCRMMMVQIEDAVGQTAQQNLPGTTHEHRNWQRRLDRPLSQIFADPRIMRLLNAIDKERHRD